MKIRNLLISLTAAVMLASCGGAGGDSSSDTSSAVSEPQIRSIKLMPFGDSITDGFWLSGGYRTTLANELEANGYSQYVDFVGRKSGGDCYDNEHEGYSGYSIDPIAEEDSISGQRAGLSSMVESSMQKFTPDVVLLQVGTNDILSLYDLDNAGERLKNLVDKTLDGLPEDGMLYLATIPYMDANDTTYIDPEYFTVEYMDECVDSYNEKVKALVEEEKADGKNIELADVNSVLTKDDLYDGVHPSKDGYEKLGEFWYGVVSDYITQDLA
jgi:lysophospholipase L1-like esterase